VVPPGGAVTFGLHLRRWPRDGGDPLAYYRALVDPLPPAFTTLWASDHFQDESPNLEAWTLLTFLAAMFPDRRVGSLVLGQRYRNPALLAKMAASLQCLSGGRLVLGIGAGWHEPDHVAYGYGLPSRGDRVAQLREYVEILRALWGGGPVTYAGRHYSVEGAYCRPVPDPPIPLLVGTNGPRVLRIAADLADLWNWDGLRRLYEPPLDTLRALPGGDAIGLTANLDVHLPEDPAEFVPEYDLGYEGMVGEWFGPTPERLVAQLGWLLDQGVRHFVVGPKDEASLATFCRDVVPLLVGDSLSA
jgi:alkanesulfonate monooxygenase SsuD/methylene tetrahydromethanopterin reductase-like flavin-dependent oxidoreductase (luciferase family)